MKSGKGKSATDKNSPVVAGKSTKKIPTNMVKDGSAIKAPGIGGGKKKK